MRNRNKTNILFLAIIILNICACNSTQKRRENKNEKVNSILVENKVIGLPKTQKLKLKTHDVEVIGLWHGISVDTLCFFRTAEYKNSLSIYNLNNLKYKGRILETGDGPKSFLQLGTTNDFFYHDNELFYWVYDYWLKKIRLVNVTKSLTTNTTAIEEEFSYKDMLNHLCFVDDSSIICSRYTPTTFEIGYLYLPDMSFKSYFDVIKQKEQPFEMTYVSSNAVLKSDKTKYALAMISFNQLLISDVKGSHRFAVSIGEPLSLNYLVNTERKQLKNYFGVICSTNKQIWVIYNDMTTAEFRNNKIDLQSKILVFDWDGNILFNFQTEQKLNSIVLDKKNGVLLGIDINERIYEYGVSDYIQI